MLMGPDEQVLICSIINLNTIITVLNYTIIILTYIFELIRPLSLNTHSFLNKIRTYIDRQPIFLKIIVKYMIKIQCKKHIYLVERDRFISNCVIWSGGTQWYKFKNMKVYSKIVYH